MIATAQIYRRFNRCHEKLQLLVKPNGAMAAADLAPGDLVLAPMSNRIDKKHGVGSIPLGQFALGGPKAETVFMSPHNVLPCNHAGVPSPNPCVVPFWHITPVADPPFNCYVRCVVSDGIRIPIIANKDMLSVGESLRVSKKELDAFGSCTDLVELVDGEVAALTAAPTGAKGKKRGAAGATNAANGKKAKAL